MALNDIIFNIGSGGLGRPLAGEDHICGIAGYMVDGDLPTGFTVGARIVRFTSIEDAETAGLVTTSTAEDVVIISYAIKTLFLMEPKSIVYVGCFAKAVAPPLVGSPEFAQLLELQRFADGKIRQLCVVTNEALVVGDITLMQANADILLTESSPLSIIYSCDTSNFASSNTSPDSLADLPDLRALAAPNVSVCIGADGDGLAASLFTTHGVAFTIAGAVTGVLARGKVHENIAWIAPNNINANVLNEFAVPILSGGDLVKQLAPATLDTLNDDGYIFILNKKGIAGTYFNDTHTATPVAGDFAYIENNRVIYKAVRGVETFLLPSLNAPLVVNPNGTLSEDTIAGFENDANRALEQMERDGEISAFEVTIDPSQDVLTTSKIVLTIKIVPVGVARNIEVNIGFSVRLS